jgi:hypothetical protein
VIFEKVFQRYDPFKKGGDTISLWLGNYWGIPVTESRVTSRHDKPPELKISVSRPFIHPPRLVVLFSCSITNGGQVALRRWTNGLPVKESGFDQMDGGSLDGSRAKDDAVYGFIHNAQDQPRLPYEDTALTWEIIRADWTRANAAGPTTTSSDTPGATSDMHQQAAMKLVNENKQASTPIPLSYVVGCLVCKWEDDDEGE